MKMMDMGQTDEERYDSPIGVSLKESKNKKHYDSIMMMGDKMPMEMHAGEMHKMCVEMMVKSVEKEESGKTKYKMELRKIGKMPEMEKELNPYKKSREE